MTAQRASVLLIALLAATPVLAQKPDAEELDPARSRFRDRALAVCVVDINGARPVQPEISESVCGCAVGRFMRRGPTADLPRLEGPRIPPVMGGDVVACAAEEDPRLAAAMVRRMAQAPVAEPRPAAPPIAPIRPDKPQAPPDEDEDNSLGFDPGAWFEGLSWPRWLTDTGLPIWILVPLGLFVLLFLRGLTRRSEDRDLLGPPPGMRRTQVTPPRRP
jgi:hypothetical protein